MRDFTFTGVRNPINANSVTNVLLILEISSIIAKLMQKRGPSSVKKRRRDH